MLGVLRQLRMGSSTIPACKNTQINPRTFYRWKLQHPRFADLAEGIISSRIVVVEDALFQAAAIDRNISAIIFFLTNRAGDKWADRRALVNNTNVFNAKNEVGKNGNSDTLEQTLKRIEEFKADLIPPSDAG